MIFVQVQTTPQPELTPKSKLRLNDLIYSTYSALSSFSARSLKMPVVGST